MIKTEKTKPRFREAGSDRICALEWEVPVLRVKAIWV